MIVWAGGHSLKRENTSVPYASKIAPYSVFCELYFLPFFFFFGPAPHRGSKLVHRLGNSVLFETPPLVYLGL